LHTNIDEIDEIAELYDEHLTGHLRPTYRKLEGILEHMLAKVSRHFVIVDGLDHISDSQQYLILKCLANLGSTANILIFSESVYSEMPLANSSLDRTRIVRRMGVEFSRNTVFKKSICVW
jgi:hypothetical protein